MSLRSAIVIALACTVRGCGAELAPSAAGLACPRGHAFDRARSGYVNLLQPHDRRSLDAGDSREAVSARRRLFASGLYAPWIEELGRALADAGVERGARTLDVGCGEGSILAALAERFELDAAGLDRSVHAVEAAARAHPSIAWIVANGDRRLPVRDGALDLVLSITARRSPNEFARVLRPGGRLLLAVPGADDLAELRAAAMGSATDLAIHDPFAEFDTEFERSEARVFTHRVEVLAEQRADLLIATYRGARGREERVLAEGGARTVTLSWRVAVLVRSRRA
ncbi:MAG: methyltransferase domain-containing protein [Planctomycetes bacterium]|nr:methyltransferase domain-containing protein [Planctomycetota bacterium]